jgi:hypothetical protein
MHAPLGASLRYDPSHPPQYSGGAYMGAFKTEVLQTLFQGRFH